MSSEDGQIVELRGAAEMGRIMLNLAGEPAWEPEQTLRCSGFTLQVPIFALSEHRRGDEPNGARTKLPRLPTETAMLMEVGDSTLFAEADQLQEY